MLDTMKETGQLLSCQCEDDGERCKEKPTKYVDDKEFEVFLAVCDKHYEKLREQFPSMEVIGEYGDKSCYLRYKRSRLFEEEREEINKRKEEFFENQEVK